MSVAAALLCLAAFGATSVGAAASHASTQVEASAPEAAVLPTTAPSRSSCAIGVLGICLVPSPAPSPTPTPAPPAPTSTSAPAPATAPAGSIATPPPAATPSGAATASLGGTVGTATGAVTGVIGATTGTPAGATTGTTSPAAAGPSTAAPQCTLDVLGNCLSVLPGLLGPVQQPAAGSGTGLDLTLPTGTGQLPILSLGQQGCLAALLGSCAAGTTPSDGPAQGCVATLLSLCVPNLPGTGGTGGPLPTTCLVGGLVCLSPPPCAGSTCPLGGTPGTSPTGVPGTGAPAGPAGTSSIPTDATATNASRPVPLTGIGGFNGGVTAPLGLGAQQTSSAPSITQPVVPSSSPLGWLSGLHLGSLLLWPIFAVLDVLAAAALVLLARRSWSAAPGD